MITRSLTAVVKQNLYKWKVIVSIGPRQVWKTTLLNSLLKNTSYLFLDRDYSSVGDTLANANTETFKKRGH